MLFEAYAKLVSNFPDDCDQLFGQALTTDNALWLSVDGEDYPSLLFTARRSETRNDIELRSVSVRFSRDCVIETADGEASSGTYTIVRLSENDPDIARMLLRLLEETFQSRKKLYTNKEIADRILELAELFKQISKSTGDIVGLWGELYILSRSRDLNIAAQCWCRSKNAKYDYVTEAFALEVKTTLLSRRMHRFSLDQLRPVSEFQVYIGSLAAVEINSGSTTADLMDGIYAKITDENLCARFLAQCLVKGGSDIYRNTLKLGVFPNDISLMIFDSSKIPVPKIAPASPIEDVRFNVDLSEFGSISHHEMNTILEFGMAEAEVDKSKM